MDRENCTGYQATDNLMFVSPDKCAVNFVGFVIWMLLIATLKSAQAFGLFYDWRKRYAKASKNSGRKPVVPLLLAFQALGEFIYLCLTATNILNAKNGGAFALYCWLYFIFSCYSFILIRRFINLGKRLIPIAKASIEGQRGREQVSSEEASVSSRKAETQESCAHVRNGGTIAVVPRCTCKLHPK